MTLARSDAELLVATEKGYGKRTSLDSYRRQSRGGKGIKTMNLSDKTGKIVETAVVDDTDKIVIITVHGIMLKIQVKEIRSCGRSTQGVKLINLDSGDMISSLARVPKAEAPEDSKAQPRPAKKSKDLVDLADEELDEDELDEELEDEELDEDEEEPEE